jgi:hypothetical protein
MAAANKKANMNACISSIWSLRVESRTPLKIQMLAETNSAKAKGFI